jgi:hypothetical protein
MWVQCCMTFITFFTPFQIFNSMPNFHHISPTFPHQLYVNKNNFSCRLAHQHRFCSIKDRCAVISHVVLHLVVDVNGGDCDPTVVQ